MSNQQFLMYRSLLWDGFSALGAALLLGLALYSNGLALYLVGILFVGVTTRSNLTNRNVLRSGERKSDPQRALLAAALSALGFGVMGTLVRIWVHVDPHVHFMLWIGWTIIAIIVFFGLFMLHEARDALKYLKRQAAHS